MTLFEILIIGCIYLFCYGYALAMFIKEKDIWLVIVWMIASLGVAFYVPVLIGSKVFEKLNDKRA